MTDLEMTRLCAEAMALQLGDDWNQGPSGVMLGGFGGRIPTYYDPLHDDAQAMALVKKFTSRALDAMKHEYSFPRIKSAAGTGLPVMEPVDLNRAIVECVAKMQAAKGTA